MLQAIADQLVQAVTEALFNRPELAQLREPIQTALRGDEFKKLTLDALTTLESRTKSTLPGLLTADFVASPITQRYLAAFIVDGEASALDDLAALYARHFPTLGRTAELVRAQLEPYAHQLRETFVTHPIHGPILLSRDIQAMSGALNHWFEETRQQLTQMSMDIKTDFERVFGLFNQLLEEPEVKALVERKSVRECELVYLEDILQKHGDWQTVYTPMAGIVRQEQYRKEKSIKRRALANFELVYALRKKIHETFGEPLPVVEIEFSDITDAVNKARQLVVLGDPGAGKTTTLWKLAADYAALAQKDANAPLPVFVRLGALPVEVEVRQQIQSQLGEGIPLETLLEEKRLALLFDALNELPENRRVDKVGQVRDLIDFAQKHGMIAVVTCRELDYQGGLDLNIPQQVTITPLDPARIRQFCHNHLPDDGEALFWALAGGEGAREAFQAWEKAGATFEMFWTEEEIPSENPNVYSSTTLLQDEAWGNARSSRSLMNLGSNPYMLFMMTEVYAETTSLPQNRGKLFALFTHHLLTQREGLDTSEAKVLRDGLASLAYTIQKEGLGTSVPRMLALAHLPAHLLYRAVSANLLDGGDELRFTHQLLQEYFTAQELDRLRKEELSAVELWPADRWWEPQGWEEAAVLLAGLYGQDSTSIINWLRDANPEVAVRCIMESGAYTPSAVFASLKQRWLLRLTNLKSDPHPAARAAVGRALGLLNLDDRPGVGVIEIVNTSGTVPLRLPDIAWGTEIPTGIYTVGGDKEAEQSETQQVEIKVPYCLARYPITYAQFQTFLDAEDGFNQDKWWEGTPEEYMNQAMAPQQWAISNHPRENVLWYQVVAFCAWLNAQYNDPKLRLELPDHCQLPEGWTIRLPHEWEWEIAARYPDRRKYPWGDEYILGNANIDESGLGGTYLERTTAVGLYPQGGNPEIGLDDISGNVWEWCRNKYDTSDDISADRTEFRVMRGGSWGFDPNLARSALRLRFDPLAGFNGLGFRVVAAPPVS